MRELSTHPPESDQIAPHLTPQLPHHNIQLGLTLKIIQISSPLGRPRTLGWLRYSELAIRQNARLLCLPHSSHSSALFLRDETKLADPGKRQRLKTR